MKFPIGFEWAKGYFTYEVIGYESDDEKPYIVRYGIDGDHDLCMYLTEGELTVMSEM